MAQLRFSDIDFGFASAETEGAQRPALLLEGFLDLRGVRDKVLRGPDFLCLGYKGSGKSAISEHLRLVAETQSDLFVRRMFLADFPFSDFANILRGSQDVKSRYPATWQWLLFPQTLNSLAPDQGATSTYPASFANTIETLKRYALLPTPSLHEIVLKSSERGFPFLSQTQSKAPPRERSQPQPTLTSSPSLRSCVDPRCRSARTARTCLS
jgi:hypothetical protein